MQTPSPGRPRNPRRRALVLLVVLAAIPLVIAGTLLVQAGALTGSPSRVAGRVTEHHTAGTPSKPTSRQWWTTIDLATGGSVSIDDQELFDSAPVGTQVMVRSRSGRPDRVTLPGGRDVAVASATGSLVEAAFFGGVGLILLAGVGVAARRTGPGSVIIPPAGPPPGA
jgi:hypothetical protein